MQTFCPLQQSDHEFCPNQIIFFQKYAKELCTFILREIKFTQTVEKK